MMAAKKKAPAVKSRTTRNDTDLERHVNARGRAQLVKQVREKINELGITYIYYQFVSVTGRIVGKGIPADHWERIAEKGFQLVYGATANLFVDRHGDYIGYGPEASELVGIPDPETFCQLPWDKRVARVFCTCFRNREEQENPGGHLTSDCRGNLRIIHEEFQAKHNGLHLRAGTEPEMMWLKKGEDGKPERRRHQAVLLSHRPVRELRPVFMKVIEYSQRHGPRHDPGRPRGRAGPARAELQYDDVLRNADRLTTYRQICAQVAREFDLIACFMSKPFMGVSASGCHHNMSLWRGGEDTVNTLGTRARCRAWTGTFTYREGGENTFMPDPKLDERKPGPIGLQCIGGVIEHLGALTAIGSSTVNSYRRLWDTGLLGAGVRRLGLPEPHLRAAHLGAGPLRVPLGRFHGQSVPDGRRAAQGLRRRHHATTSTRASRRSATSTRPWKPASRSRSCPCPWARRWTRWRRTRSSSRRCRTRCTGSSCTTSATSGRGSITPSPTGI